MSTLALTPAVAQAFYELVHKIVPGATETVVLDTELKACYPGLTNGNPDVVKLDISGSANVPVGATSTIEVHWLNMATGAYTLVASTVVVNGTQSELQIPAASHGVTAGGGCRYFQIRFVITYPPPQGGGAAPAPKTVMVKGILLCEKCDGPVVTPGGTKK